MHNVVVVVRVTVLIALLASVPAFSEPVIEIAGAYNDDIAIQGTAPPGTGPITILDISYRVETPIGYGDVSDQGRFIAILKLPLTGGHKLVAVNQNGQRSEAFTVVSSPRPPEVGYSLE